MELINNYNKAVKELLEHIGFGYGSDFTIVDCTMFYWHLALGKVVYSRSKNVDDNPFNSTLVNKNVYDCRVFSGNKLTGTLTGEPLGVETLEIFDNSKYVGNGKAEKIYL